MTTETVVNFNVNERVKVKLTEKGIDILKQRHDSMNTYIGANDGEPIKEFEIKLDEDGYYTTQLWVLMHVFGEHMSWGSNLPFETEIQFVTK